MYTPPEQVRDEVRFWLAQMHKAAAENDVRGFVPIEQIERETTEIVPLLIEAAQPADLVEVCSITRAKDGLECEFRKRTQIESKVERAGFFITERAAIILNGLKPQSKAA